MQDLFMKSTLDSIFKVGFGVELDTLSGSNREGSMFAKAFDASSEVILRRYYDVFWKMKRLLNIGAEAALKEHLKVIDGFVYKVIEGKTQQISAQQDASVSWAWRISYPRDPLISVIYAFVIYGSADEEGRHLVEIPVTERGG